MSDHPFYDALGLGDIARQVEDLERAVLVATQKSQRAAMKEAGERLSREPDAWTHEFVLYEPAGWRNRARWELRLRREIKLFSGAIMLLRIDGDDVSEWVLMASGRVRRPRGARLIRIRGRA